MVTAGNGVIDEEPTTINGKKAANGSGTPKTPKKDKKKEKSPEPEPEEEEEEAADGMDAYDVLFCTSSSSTKMSKNVVYGGVPD